MLWACTGCVVNRPSPVGTAADGGPLVLWPGADAPKDGGAGEPCGALRCGVGAWAGHPLCVAPETCACTRDGGVDSCRTGSGLRCSEGRCIPCSTHEDCGSGACCDLASGDCLSRGWKPVSVQAERGSPRARQFAAWAVDERQRRVLLVGGAALDARELYADAWSLSFAGELAWNALPTPSGAPGRRWGSAAVVDPGRARLWVHGGRSGFFSPLRDAEGDLTSLSFERGAWLAEVVTGLSRYDLYLHAAAFDPVGDRIVLFGGAFSTGGVRTVPGAVQLGDGGASWAEGPVSVGGGTVGATLTYDPLGQRMLAFGGSDRDDALSPVATVTELRLAANRIDGQPLLTRCALLDGCPAARAFATAAFDGRRNRLVVSGGLDASGAPLSDTWALWLGEASPRWELLVVAKDREALPGGFLVVDAERDRLLSLQPRLPAWSHTELFATPLACE